LDRVAGYSDEQIDFADAHYAGRLQPELVRLSHYPLVIVHEVGYMPFELESANLCPSAVSGRVR